jgi:hypothetical protein
MATTPKNTIVNVKKDITIEFKKASIDAYFGITGTKKIAIKTFSNTFQVIWSVCLGRWVFHVFVTLNKNNYSR